MPQKGQEVDQECPGYETLYGAFQGCLYRSNILIVLVCRVDVVGNFKDGPRESA